MHLLRRALLGIIVLPVLWCQDSASPSPHGGTGNGRDDDLAAIRADIDALRQDQKVVQKTLQTVKDILMGKAPPLENVLVGVAGSPILGNPSASLTMVEFSDYQCPYCGVYARQTFAKVVDRYVKTGKMRYVVRSFPLAELHPLAEKSAEASLCAGEQGKYWEAHDLLFVKQQALQVANLRDYAISLGLDGASFQQCLDSGRFARKVSADLAEGQDSGVNATPAFFLGFTDPHDPSRIQAVKLLSGAMPFHKFEVEIDSLLSQVPTDR
jgi:protein-disulfide isomerase